MAAQRRRHDLAGQHVALRHVDLEPNEVEPGDSLRHRVLHLEARVHLEEPEPAVLVEEELGGRRVLETGRPGCPDGQSVDVAPLAGL
jgi:hypothetical protein